MTKTKNKSEKVKQVSLYILEEKLSRGMANKYCAYILELRKNQRITKPKYRNLEKRFNEEWIILDAVSFSRSYDCMVREYMKWNKKMPWKEYRFVKANAVLHEEYGISITDFDYERVEILFTWKDEVVSMVKELLLEPFDAIRNNLAFIKKLGVGGIYDSKLL